MTLLCLIITGLAAVFMYQSAETGKPNRQYDLGLPWQITVANGNSSVFGLSPGSSTLNDAIAQLGDDYELALLERSGQQGALELYFSRFQTGPLQGKLIVSATISEAEVQAIKMDSVKQEYLENGTKKFSLGAMQRKSALKLFIEGITLVPAASIDAAVIQNRFGSPSQIIKSNNQLSHYVYEKQGLTVSIDTKGKEVLHYVRPSTMTDLISLLRVDALDDALTH